MLIVPFNLNRGHKMIGAYIPTKERTTPLGDCVVCGGWIRGTTRIEKKDPARIAALIADMGEEKARIKCPSAFSDREIVREECPDCGDVREMVKKL